MPYNPDPMTTNPFPPFNPKLAHCRTCGALIAKSAKTCPHCGATIMHPIRLMISLFLRISITLFVLFLLLVIIALGSDTSGTSTTSSSRASSSSSSASTVPESSSPVESETVSNVFMVGDVAETKHLKITYQECDSDWRGYTEYYRPKNGNKVVRAFFVFENISNSDQNCGHYDFSCYADQFTCSSFSCTSDDILYYTTIPPGRKAQGCVLFEVPVDAEEIELEYEDSFDFFSNKKLIFTIE